VVLVFSAKELEGFAGVVIHWDGLGVPGLYLSSLRDVGK